MTHARDPKQRIHPPTPHPPSPPQKSFRFVCARVLAYGLQWKFISQGGCAISRFPLGGRRTFSFPSHSPNCLSNFSWAYQKHLRIRFREYDLMTFECRNEADNAMSNFSLLCCMVSLNKFLFRLGVHSVNRRTMLGHCWACKRMSQKCFGFAK